ncbi:MAG: HAD domain-containing protein [Burkholderiales bacterium]
MVLFLDFDGVLHPQYDGQAVPENVAFCHLPRFESLMRAFHAVEIVISST